ncbi:MAG TPA: metallophosphoesterase [Roseiflexaceae bacterium]|nr:metallophosphoesterase [Roseiflexaceae bacterium]
MIRIGLIADTHMPARCAALPAALFEVLRGVELLLHAGDVGELWVLDRLSAIAPVVAVHGNDETADARRELPYQQVLTVAGVRILLTHAHYPDRAEELASRADDAWGPKLARRAAMGRHAAAQVVVFGHTHIPMACRYDGMLLVNPGAIAPPNVASRQVLRSVAMLCVGDGGAVSVTHVDLAAPGERFEPQVDLEAGFAAAHRCVTASILSPELEARAGELRALGGRAPEVMRAVTAHLAHRCWSGGQALITSADLLAALRADPSVPPELLADATALLAPAERGG